jgi:nucleotide-binding universal stress UspA family protein
MFGTIVIGVDGRSGGRDALALGSVIGEALDAELVAATAYPYSEMPSRAASPAYRDALADDAAATLERELTETGVSARRAVVPDTSPARGLHALAEQEGAGVIVIGSPHRSRLGRMLLGDVTHSTLSASPCAVAVAPEGFAGRSIATIGVGFDDTPESRRALEVAAGLARRAGARLQVVAAVATSSPLSMHKAYIDPEVQQEGSMKAMRAVLDEAVAGLEGDVTADVVADNAVGALSDLSGRVDLLVLGSRNWGPVKRLMVGSTSHAVVAHARCAVLVLPRGAEAEEAGADGSTARREAGASA